MLAVGSLGDAPPTCVANDVGPESAERVIHAWLADKKEATRRVYRGGLRSFAGFAGAHDDVAAVQGLLCSTRGEAHEVCVRYRERLAQSGLATSSVRRLLATIRSVVKEAKLLGLIDWEIELKLPRRARIRDVRGPDMDELVVLQAALERADDPLAERDQAIFSLLVDLGLRRAEVAGLELEHIDGTRAFLSVIRKGEDERELVPLPEQTWAAVAAWLDVRGLDAGPLFWRGSGRRLLCGQRLSAQGIWWMLRSRSFRAGLKQVRPHGIRHTAISHLAEEGVPLPHLLRFTGHRSIQSVQTYLDTVADRRRELSTSLAARRIGASSTETDCRSAAPEDGGRQR